MLRDPMVEGKASAMLLATAVRASWVSLEGSYCLKRAWLAEVSRLGGSNKVKGGYNT